MPKTFTVPLFLETEANTAAEARQAAISALEGIELDSGDCPMRLTVANESEVITNAPD
jgi:hypothetical protein